MWIAFSKVARYSEPARFFWAERLLDETPRLANPSEAAVRATIQVIQLGVPIARVSPEQPTRLLPVHEFAVAGTNDIALIVHPALPGMPPEPQAQLSDGKAWASVQLLLPRMGQISHPSNARTLAQLQWQVPDGEVYETPLCTVGQVELPIAFPRWRWQ